MIVTVMTGHKYLLTTLGLCFLFLNTACVYEVDVQQGNKLEPQDIETVEVGMTRNQVRYLLGTPVVDDVFRDNRWDYIYYFRPGKSKKVERRWLIVWFDGNVVTKIERDVPIEEPPERIASES